LRAVHEADVSAARAIGCTSTPFYELEEPAARRFLDWLLENGTLGQPLHDRLGGILAQMFEAMRDTAVVLTHSDAGPHNTVWDGTKAIPVDFETAAVAPPDLDLECLLRTLNLNAGPNPAYAVLQEASDLLAEPGAGSRLLGYAVLRDMWETRSWLGDLRGGGSLQDPEADVNDPSTWLPVRQLQRHVARTSWMAELLR
jgi:aminoglycoside phosphotransferase (APT) family kinase protein